MMDLQGMGCWGMDWIELAQTSGGQLSIDHSGSINCGEFLD
jgi:hypothetical protein